MSLGVFFLPVEGRISQSDGNGIQLVHTTMVFLLTYTHESMRIVYQPKRVTAYKMKKRDQVGYRARQQWVAS